MKKPYDQREDSRGDCRNKMEEPVVIIAKLMTADRRLAQLSLDLSRTT